MQTCYLLSKRLKHIEAHLASIFLVKYILSSIFWRLCNIKHKGVCTKQNCVMISYCVFGFTNYTTVTYIQIPKLK